MPKPAPLVFRGKPRGKGKLRVKMKQATVLCCSSQRSAAQPAPGCGCCVLDTLCSPLGWSRHTLRDVKPGFGGIQNPPSAACEVPAHVARISGCVWAGRTRGSSVFTCHSLRGVSKARSPGRASVSYRSLGAAQPVFAFTLPFSLH